MKKYIGNSKAFGVDVIFGNDVIKSMSFDEFKYKVKQATLEFKEIKAFCFPVSIDLGLIVCIILFSAIIFELLVIACIFTVRNG